MGLCGERGKFYAELCERLTSFAEFEFKNSRREKDGATEGEHKSSAARQMAALGWDKSAAEVMPDPPPFPFEVGYLWAWFCQYAKGLPVNGMAPASATWEGVAAWAALMRIDMEPWEANVMIDLGLLRSNVVAEKMNADQKK